MRLRIILIISTVVCLVSCNSIPNKSIFNSLTSDELAPIIKKDTLFGEFYEYIQESIKSFNEVEKAKYKDITYRSLYKVAQYTLDTAKVAPLKRQWQKEWNEQYGGYDAQVDSVLNYWAMYKAENSLDRFVNIEFAEVDKDYYSYSYDVRNVNLGFRLTPLQGKVEQVKFNYRYSAKINEFWGEKHRCISTTPFSSSVVRYWEVEYSDEQRLKSVSTSEFVRDYNIEIEITDVRKDGTNYSIDDLHIPSCVKKTMDTDQGKYPYLYRSYRNGIITELLCSSYKLEYVYVSDKLSELLKSMFPRDYSFLEYLEDKE